MMSGLKNLVLVKYWKVGDAPAFAAKDAQIHPKKHPLKPLWINGLAAFRCTVIHLTDFIKKRVSGHFTFFVFATFGFASVR